MRFLFFGKKKNIFDKNLNNINFQNNKNIIFLYRNKFRRNGSTMMRAFQLSHILNSESDLETFCISDKYLNDIKNSIVIVNKSFLRESSNFEFEILIKNKNIICSDFMDLEEKKSQVNFSFILIASSRKQYDYFCKKYNNKIIHHLTHHVDPRISDLSREFKKVRIGYFGEYKNGLLLKDLNRLLDIYKVNTKFSQNTSWIQSLDKYNVHYIIRNDKRIIKNKKPFLKGFTAAKKLSNIIANSNDGDSLYYLTKDYPYYVNSNNLKDIKNEISFVNETYNSKIWFDALEIIKSIRINPVINSL